MKTKREVDTIRGKMLAKGCSPAQLAVLYHTTKQNITLIMYGSNNSDLANLIRDHICVIIGENMYDEVKNA